MAHRLCLVAGGCVQPRELLKRMTAADMAEWQAYYRIHPFGQEHTDYLLAQLAAVINNRWRGKNEPPSKASDYLPMYEPPQQTWQQIRGVLRSALGRV